MSNNLRKGGLALRKYIFIALSVLLLLTFATLVYAEEPQIKLGGRIMVRGWYFSNASFATGSLNNVYALPGEISGAECRDVALWTTNISLTMDAKVSDNVQGFLELEVAQGGNSQSGLYIWGYNGYGPDSKPNADLLFRQAWIQYTGSGLLGVPSGLKVGHQLLTLGEKQFLNHERFGDDAVLVFVEPTKELLLAAVTAKLNEGNYTLAYDDIDAYVLLGTYKIDKDNTIGLYYFYANNSDLEKTFASSNYTGLNGLSLQDLGLHGNGKLAQTIDYAYELDTQFGKAEGQPGIDDIKYQGYAIYLKGGYKIPETPLNVRASFALGSGDENGVSNLNAGGDHKIKEFQVTQGFDTESPIARFVHYTQIYERTIATASLIQTIGGSGGILYPHRNTGIANTTYYNLGLDLAATKDLAMSLDGFILRATKTDGWSKVLGGSDVSKNVGWELDFKGSYKLAKNLTYFVEAGTFRPGKFYEDTSLVSTDKTVSQVIHGLNLTF
jgi:hypothetical protein